MILNNRYRELMEQVTVTKEMRARILANIERPQTFSRPSPRHPLYRWMALAACFALIFTAGITLFRDSTPPSSGMGVGITSPFREASSAEELSSLLGFSIPEAPTLPFPPESVLYRAIGDNMADITYRSAANTAVFRKSPGAEENSGDYTQYPTVKSIALPGLTGELRGDDTGYLLACWQNEAYSFSLKVSAAMDEASLLACIPSLSI